jgi:hypothetical protein
MVFTITPGQFSKSPRKRLIATRGQINIYFHTRLRMAEPAGKTQRRDRSERRILLINIYLSGLSAEQSFSIKPWVVSEN